MAELSYAKTIILAEEIANNLKTSPQLIQPSQSSKQDKGPFSIPPIPKEPTVNTEEKAPTTPHIINHNLNDADRWYEVKLSRNLVTWQLRCRENYDISYSYSPTHQTYMTLSAGNVLSADTSPNSNINAVYVMCENQTIVELECWTK